MILNFLNMDGHGIFVWSAFVFTMVNFVTLYFIISKNLKKEKIKFFSRYSIYKKDKDRTKNLPESKETVSAIKFAVKSKN